MVWASRSSAQALSPGSALRRHEVGQLHEQEREIALAPALPASRWIMAGKSLRYW